MKSKKVTMLAAALVVAVVAAAGIGFATTYTATTTNTENNAQSAYLLIEQTGTGEGTAAYDGNWLTKVYFNTTNNAANDNDYELITEWGIDSNNTISKSATTKNLALISKNLDIEVTKVNSTDSQLDVVVTTENLTPIDDAVSYMMALGEYEVDPTTSAVTISNAVLVPGNTDSNGKTTWTFTGAVTNDLTFSLLIFLQCSELFDSDPGATAGFDEDSQFKITVSATE
jgi:hypothetical protein